MRHTYYVVIRVRLDGGIINDRPALICKDRAEANGYQLAQEQTTPGTHYVVIEAQKAGGVR